MSTTYDVRPGTDTGPGVAAAVDALRRGELVVLPTDTVYGVAADAFNGPAVGALLEAKGRSREMPVPVLVGAWRTLDGLADDVTDQMRELVEAFWPGGLTLVVRHAQSLSWDLGETRGTVAVRMPMHPVTLAVLAQTGPLAVSSANRSGLPPAPDAAEAARQLGTAVSVYLDGGATRSGVTGDGPDTGAGTPSTILDLTGERARLLRVGAISRKELAVLLPELDEPELDEPELDEPELDEPELDEIDPGQLP